GRGRSEEAGGRPAVDGGAILVAFNEVGIAVVLDGTGDLVERLVPGNLLEAVRTRPADARMGQAAFRLHVGLEGRALRAQGAAVDRMVGVALDVEQFGLLAGVQVATRVHDDSARHRTVGADVAGFGGGGQLELADMGGSGGFSRSKSHGPERAGRRPGPRQLQKAAAGQFDSHFFVLLALVGGWVRGNGSLPRTRSSQAKPLLWQRYFKDARVHRAECRTERNQQEPLFQKYPQYRTFPNLA